jgi:large subunit ribosomal protein L5
MNKTYIPRLKKYYDETIVPEMMKKFGYKNSMQVPKLVKIVINIGVSEARENIKVLDIASAELMAITGQKTQVRRAKKSVSNFKLRKNMPIGLKVTLRRERMYEFLDRLISVALPRMRDFHGLDPAFDKHGNYNMGLKEQYIFPEIEVDKSDKARGMNITFVTSLMKVDESKELLVLLGMPFKK